MIRKVFSVAAVLLLSVTAAQAQRPNFGFGGGATIPTGDYGDYAKTGWIGTGFIGFPIAKALSIGAEGYYGSNDHDTEGDKTNLYGGSGYLTYRFGQPTKPGVYLIGSGGALVHQFKSETTPADESSETKFVWSAGAGVDIPVAKSVSIWLESRYMARGDTKFIPIWGGLSFAFGKSKE